MEDLTQTINQIKVLLDDLQERQSQLKAIFDYPIKQARLEEIALELSDPAVWGNPAKLELLNRERVALQNIVDKLVNINKRILDANDIHSISIELEDYSNINELLNEVNLIHKEVADLEFQKMFSGELDPNNAFLSIQAGSGGTEAQDWAEMLMRMYLRWGEHKGFNTEILEYMPGEVAGIKSITIKYTGAYAYGWLRTETGVHRLVRKSPFDSGNRRHTSFASVFVSPEVDDNINIDINPVDLKIDTYRASGAGGQHVNRTDSAVRITHLPTNIVVQCQSDRSQHKNKATALKQLKSKLYELELQKRRSELQSQEDNKAENSWGSQIRSYVLDASRIKDLRTNVETGNTQAVLDGDLDQFIEASLKAGL